MISFLIFVINLTVYLFFIHPSVAGGDAGELLSEACSLGTAHPPGYPLFTLLSHLFIRIIPSHRIFNSVASKVNFLCCLFGASSGAILYQIIFSYLQMKVEKEETNNPGFDLSYLINILSATMGSTLFSFCSLSLEYHTTTEVFALNNLLVSLILYQTVRITKASMLKEVKRESILAAFYAGLALTNQHTSFLFIVPVVIHILSILWLRMDKELVVTTFKLSLSFIAGLSPYVYLVISSWYPTAGSWGDMTSLQGFIRHVLRSEYGTFRLSPSGQKFETVENSFSRWIAYFIHSDEQFTHIGTALFTIGSFSLLANGWCYSNQSSVARVMILSIIFYLSIWNGLFSNLPLSVPMAYEVHSRFWMQPNIVYCFCIGVGSKRVLSSISLNFQKHQRSTIYVIIFVITSGFSFFSSKIKMSFMTKMILHDYANAILKTLPQNSMLLSHSDLNWNTVRYMQTCEGFRADVTHISFQLLPFPWFQRQIAAGLYQNVKFPEILPNVSTGRLDYGNAILITRFLRANLATGIFPGGLYMEMQSIADTDIDANGVYRGEFTLIPWGLVYRVLPALASPRVDLPTKWFPQAVINIYLARSHLKHYSKLEFRRGSWEHAALSVFFDMHYQLGVSLLSFALYLSRYLKHEHNLIPVYAKSLKDASKLLDQVHRAMKSRSTVTSYPFSDVIKNNALAQMRLYELLQITPKLKNSISNLPDTSDTDRKFIFNRTLVAVHEYLTYYSNSGEETGNATQDKDYMVFASFYNSLHSG